LVEYLKGIAMSIASTKLIVPNGLRQAEVEDWFHSSNNVRESIDNSVGRSTELSRRRFLKSSAAAGLILPTSAATFVPGRADASLWGLINAIIKVFSIFVPAIRELEDALKPGDPVPATEELQAGDGEGGRNGPNLFIVLDEETLRVETAAVATKLESPVTHFMNKFDVGSKEVEFLHHHLLSDTNFDWDDKAVVDVSKLGIYGKFPGNKLLTGFTAPSEKSVSFKVEE